MRRLSPFICAALLFSAIPARSSSQLGSQFANSEHRLYVSLVKKSSVTNYLNRLATPKSQVVVTKEPVAGALQTRALTITNNSNLMLVELDNEQTDLVPGELFRIENIAVIDAPASLDAEHYSTATRYFEPITFEETSVAPSRLDARPQLADRDVVSKMTIDQSFLEEKLKILSGASTATLQGKAITITERGSKAGKDNARAFLKQQYDAIGFKTSLQDYGTATNPGANFIAEKVGTDPTKIVLLTSHMDSVSNAGADDNGSGTIGALAIAAALKDKTLRYTLRIVAFDQEEKGLVGSAAYAKALNKDGTLKQVVGVIDFEMTGYDSDDDGAFHVIDCNENTSATLTAGIMRVVDRDPLRLKKVEACTNRSDHASFWKYNVPAIVISQNFFGGDGNPCYHKACDKVDIMQFDYMTRITTAVGRAVEELVVADGSN